MEKTLREQIIEEAAARIDAAATYENKVCEYKRGVTELMLRSPYLEILSNRAKYFVPGAKVNVSLDGYAPRGEPSPTGIGTILKVRPEEGKATMYLVYFDDHDGWSYVWWHTYGENTPPIPDSKIQELRERYGADNVWVRTSIEMFVRCPQQWVPSNYCELHALASGMEWPEHVIH